MTREVEVIIFEISAQWRAFSTPFCLTLVQQSLTHLSGGGLFEVGAYWRIYGIVWPRVGG